MVFFLDILTSMNEGDSLVAINALTAEHWMLCYPTRSRSLKPARNRETWQASNTRANAVIIQCKERHFLPGLKAGVSVPNFS